MDHIKALISEISTWPQISIHAHRFGGKEFRIKQAEVGHIHPGGIVDIPFPIPIHDALLADGLASNITGSPTPAGSPSASAVQTPKSKPSGSYASPISATSLKLTRTPVSSSIAKAKP
jgi:hypothetical protein